MVYVKVHGEITFSNVRDLMAGEKIYLLDTSVLIYDSESLFSFDDALVGIPIIV